MGHVDVQYGRRTGQMTFIKKFVKNNKAATAIEYGLIAALIAVAAIAAMGSLGDTLSNTFDNVADAMADS
jgi:pilus assembly protein Flp/PilA